MTRIVVGSPDPARNKSMSSPSTLLTDEEFLARPATAGKQELIDGELIALLFSIRASTSLASGSSPRTDWQPGSGLQPDVSVTWPDQRSRNNYKQGAPIIAVEISSGAKTDAEMERKRLAYLEHGSGEVWMRL